TWSFSFMVVSAMRIEAPSFLFGVAFLTIVDAGVAKGPMVRSPLRTRARINAQRPFRISK
ncbi:MAG: hypothetical protein M3362_28390, partial [Acidobacteriota bacterium]|nr:hypothetical protein [Acidobacteriota bacterium]